MRIRIDAIVEALRKKGFNNFGVADMLDLVAANQEIASAAWTDALEARAREARRNPDDPGKQSMDVDLTAQA